MFDPSTTPFYPRCAFHALTGWQCPGCGATRALYQLLHGHIREAVRFNAILFLLGPFLLIAGGSEVRTYINDAPRPRWLERPWIGWAAATLVMTWWIGRNLFHL
jgi:hypothetical protein